MFRYTVIIECSDMVQDKFAIGCIIGHLVDNNQWTVIKTYHDDEAKAAITILGFSNEIGAAKACSLIDEEGIVGIIVYAEEITKNL